MWHLKHLFTGRLSVGEYWLGLLLLLVIVLLPFTEISPLYKYTGAQLWFNYVGYLFAVFVITSLNVRRLHDLNLTGWLTPVLYIPVIGWFFWNKGNFISRDT